MPLYNDGRYIRRLTYHVPFAVTPAPVLTLGDLVFARTGDATYINAAGELATAAEDVIRTGHPGPIVRRNKIVWSNDPTKTPWDKNGGTVVIGEPDAWGGNTAALYTISADNQVFYQPIPAPVPGTQMIYSFYAKRGTSTSPKFAAYDTTPGQTGLIGPRNSYYTSINADTFTRVYMLFTIPAGCTSYNIYPSSASGVGTVIICGHQLEVDNGSHLPTPYQSTNATAIELSNYAANTGSILEQAANQYLDTPGTPATQTVSLTAGTYTLSMDGTGSVALSGGPTGTATASANVTFTLEATTDVTFTCAGTVTRFNLTNLPFRTSYISGASRGADSAYLPITEGGAAFWAAGKIDASFVLPVGSNIAAGTKIFDKSNELIAIQYASTITLSRKSNGGLRTVTITKNAADGLVHTLTATWTDLMVLTIDVDGTTASINANELYGDTSWEEEGDVYESDGLTNSTIITFTPSLL